MNANADPIVVEQTFDVPVSTVWKAITDKDQMRQWYFDAIPDFKPEPGFETRFDVQNKGRTYPHLWNVTEVVLEKKIAYGWRYGGFLGNSTVVWELSETPGGGAKLTLTHKGLETFLVQDDPGFSREDGEAGWNYLIRESLKAFLERPK